jgi:hypothetical protein
VLLAPGLTRAKPACESDVAGEARRQLWRRRPGARDEEVEAGSAALTVSPRVQAVKKDEVAAPDKPAK